MRIGLQCLRCITQDEETTWTNTRTGQLGDGVLRHSPNHGTLWLPNDDNDEDLLSERQIIYAGRTLILQTLRWWCFILIKGSRGCSYWNVESI